MPNPPALVCDTDALIQIFITGEVRLLKTLLNRFGIQPAIPEEVEIELLSGKFGPRVSTPLRKAVSSGAIVVLSENVVIGFLPGGPNVANAVAQKANITGKLYSQRVDLGEAYSHSWALALGSPSMSNDFNAIQVLQRHKLALPSPVLRSFDLVAFGVQCGAISEADADKDRGLLLAEREFLPRAFRNNSFGDGLTSFCPRLSDGSGPQHGPSGSAISDFERPLCIQQL